MAFEEICQDVPECSRAFYTNTAGANSAVRPPPNIEPNILQKMGLGTRAALDKAGAASNTVSEAAGIVADKVRPSLRSGVHVGEWQIGGSIVEQ